MFNIYMHIINKFFIYSSKRSWQNAETRAFLLAYMARQSEFENSKKKKFAMANVLEDLISQNVLVSKEMNL